MIRDRMLSHDRVCRSRPSTHIVPDSTSTRRRMLKSREDLPLPVLPQIPTFIPDLIEKEMFLSARLLVSWLADMLSKVLEPREGHSVYGWRASPGCVSGSMSFSKARNRYIAPKEVSMMVHDSTSLSRDWLASSTTLSALPIWPPVMVPLNTTASEITSMAIHSTIRSMAIFSHR